MAKIGCFSPTHSVAGIRHKNLNIFHNVSVSEYQACLYSWVKIPLHWRFKMLAECHGTKCCFIIVELLKYRSVTVFL
jgi:hypothetical protein